MNNKNMVSNQLSTTSQNAFCYFRCMRTLAMVLILCLTPFAPIKAQNNDVHVLSAAGFAGGGFTMSKLDKVDTHWLNRAGYNLLTGAGFQYRIGTSWAFEVEGGLEANSYLYAHTDLLLSLGYRSPFVGVQVMKMFKTGRESNFLYARLGADYLFTGGAGLEDGEFDYNYTINLSPDNLIFLAPEVGLVQFLGENNYISYGVRFRYTWTSNTITNTMRKPPELNTASATSSGNYIGFVIRYCHPFKTFERKNKGSNEGGGRIKI